MRYPLPERIGEPELLVGREKEFNLFHKWIERIPKRLSKSKVILARRKSGKTALIQRLFSGILGGSSPKIIEISDHVRKLKHGFDEHSFRKAPHS